ncbi:unnamed protein product [Ceratitis capitata]|uniref:(Mediterranean fruit fly) hypothetical protein n=1 Tax=Ceratitis capitata TaxID=7213 RepID=A0A811V2T3_CERCA|nr:unnamed protein product [Ceratitis capitata]
MYLLEFTGAAATAKIISIYINMQKYKLYCFHVVLGRSTVRLFVCSLVGPIAALHLLWLPQSVAKGFFYCRRRQMYVQLLSGNGHLCYLECKLCTIANLYVHAHMYSMYV